MNRTSEIDMPLIEKIIKEFGLDTTKRRRDLVYKRSCVAYFLRERDMPLEFIGKLLKRNHATIIYYLRTYKINKTYADFKFYVGEIETHLAGASLVPRKYTELETRIIECKLYADYIEIRKEILSRV